MRVAQLYTMPNPYRTIERRLAIGLHLNETMSKDKTEMRLVFTATLSVDVDAHDDELRAAFIKLMTMNVKNMSAPAAMLAHKTPTLALKMTSRDGVQDIPMFDEPDANHVKIS